MTKLKLVSTGDIVNYEEKLGVVVSNGLQGRVVCYCPQKDKLESNIIDLTAQKLYVNFDIDYSFLHEKLQNYIRKTFTKLHKFQYVSFENKKTGKRFYGTVVQEGSIVEVILENGINKIKGPAYMFQKEETPIIEIPPNLRHWAFSDYYYNEKREMLAVTLKKGRSKQLMLRMKRNDCSVSSIKCQLEADMLMEEDDFKLDILESTFNTYKKEDLYQIPCIEAEYVLWYHNERHFNISWSQYVYNVIQKNKEENNG